MWAWACSWLFRICCHCDRQFEIICHSITDLFISLDYWSLFTIYQCAKFHREKLHRCTRLWRQRIQIISMSSTSHALFMWDERTYFAFIKLSWILLIQAFSHLLSIFFAFCLSHVCVKVQNLSRIIKLSYSWSS